MNISVIIPTWNRARRLARALQSVFAQRLLPAEVIVVDDGSTDDTHRLVHRQFPEARYLYQPHNGVSSARNTGIHAATGDWIALLDSDDRWQPEKLALQAQSVQAHPEYKICHCDEIWIRNGLRVNPMKKHAKRGGNIFRHCLPLCVISPSAVMIQRDLFAEVGLFDERLPACEDYDLWLRICARYPVLYIDKPLLIKEGGHSDQLSRHHWGMDRFRIHALEKILASNTLDAANHAAALATLMEKLAIVIKGAVKHGNHELLESYREKQQRYCRDKTLPAGFPA
ncbi:MAG: glycosyltransferase [Gammaproteobacteria bacterium]|jgi:glycosyltransferase involved in cell wall biosynthesis|nr:glycosyltransferase [Gammaproteobacteria bacterium]